MLRSSSEAVQRFLEAVEETCLLLGLNLCDLVGSSRVKKANQLSQLCLYSGDAADWNPFMRGWSLRVNGAPAGYPIWIDTPSVFA